MSLYFSPYYAGLPKKRIEFLHVAISRQTNLKDLTNMFINKNLQKLKNSKEIPLSKLGGTRFTELLVLKADH